MDLAFECDLRGYFCHVSIVSILVLMDLAFESGRQCLYTIFRKVSILVLMDLAFESFIGKPSLTSI